MVLLVFQVQLIWIFDWWYSKPVFGWALLIGLVWLSFAVQKNIKRVLQAILFVAVSGLWAQGLGFGAENAYLVENFAVEGFVFRIHWTRLQKLGR